MILKYFSDNIYGKFKMHLELKTKQVYKHFQPVDIAINNTKTLFMKKFRMYD